MGSHMVEGDTEGEREVLHTRSSHQPDCELGWYQQIFYKELRMTVTRVELMLWGSFVKWANNSL